MRLKNKFPNKKTHQHSFIFKGIVDTSLHKNPATPDLFFLLADRTALKCRAEIN